LICRLVLITEIIAPYRVPVFNALARQPGIDLHVIFLAETDPTQREWLVPKGEIQFSYEVLRSWRRRVYGRNVLLNWSINEALRKASPDVIVCGGYNYIASWEALRWARRHQTPFLLWVESTVQDSRNGSSFIESLKIRFIGRCNAFVVPGRASFEYLRDYDIAEERIFTARNAVDNAFFSQATEATRAAASAHRKMFDLPERYFLFAGRLETQKGVFDLIEAYAALAGGVRSEVGLVFAGDGSARAQLARRAAAIGSGSIRIAGFLQRQQLAIFYALAEVFVLPTHTDPWGLVVNEAMACGLPVICSRAAGSAADLVNDGNGRLIDKGDVSQLLSAMNELARDPQGRLLMGKKSLEKIQPYCPESCAEGIADAVLSCSEASYVCA